MNLNKTIKIKYFDGTEETIDMPNVNDFNINNNNLDNNKVKFYRSKNRENVDDEKNIKLLELLYNENKQ
jgi:hypothetical protein